MPGTSLCSRIAIACERSGQTPARIGIGEEPPRRGQEAVEPVELEQRLRHRELSSRRELLLEALELELCVVGRRVHRDADEERRRAVDRLADVVDAFVQPGSSRTSPIESISYTPREPG